MVNVVLAGLFLASCVLSCGAAQPDNSISLVHDFLQACYPELFGKEHVLRISMEGPIDNSWRKTYGIHFEVKLYDGRSEKYLNPPLDARTGKRIAVPENTTLLQGIFWFPRGDGRLYQLSLDGDAAHSKQNEAVHRLVEAHPEWSETDVIRVLKEAGAHYIPKDAHDLPAEKQWFLQSIQLEELKKLMGPFSVKSVRFEGVGNVERHAGDAVSLEWEVDVDLQSPGQEHRSCNLILEPFEGKLTGVVCTALNVPDASPSMAIP